MVLGSQLSLEYEYWTPQIISLPPEQFCIGAGLHWGTCDAPITSELLPPLAEQPAQHPPPALHCSLL